MRNLLVILLPFLLLTACALPRESEERWARPPSEAWCERHAAGGGPADGTIPYYDRDGTPYFAGPTLGFRDPYFRAVDPLKEQAVGDCLEEESMS